MAEDSTDILDDILAPQAPPERLVAEANTATLIAIRARYDAYRRFVVGKAAGDDAKLVMDDMKTFTRGDDSAYAPDERTHVLLTGRQEVFLRFMDPTRLSFDEYVEKYTRR